MEEKTRVKVELTIEAEDLEPEKITQKLGIIPEVIHRRGEILKNNSVRKNGSWKIVQEFEESYDITIQLNKLLDLIKGKEERIKEMKEYYNAIIIVSVIIQVENSDVPGIVIEEKVSTVMAEIGGEIDVDIYLMS